MRFKIFLIIFTIVSGIAEPAFSFTSGRKNWDSVALNTAARAEYLTENERAVVYEINKLRTDPYAYAVEYLEPMLTMYRGKILYMPGNDPILTREGIAALRNAIYELKKAKPAPPLLPDPRLTLAARDHQNDQSRTGQTGHVGSDGSTLRKRIDRHAKWDRSISENIFYGDPDAVSVVLHLVIDDGIPGRGHRINFLDEKMRYVGISCGTHKVYRYMCVMNFTAGFKAEVQPSASEARE